MILIYGHLKSGQSSTSSLARFTYALILFLTQPLREQMQGVVLCLRLISNSVTKSEKYLPPELNIMDHWARSQNSTRLLSNNTSFLSQLMLILIPAGNLMPVMALVLLQVLTEVSSKLSLEDVLARGGM